MAGTLKHHYLILNTLLLPMIEMLSCICVNAVSRIKQGFLTS